MDHFIRIAFWIVTLSVCLQAKPLPKSFDMDIENINLVEKNVKCDSNSTFYSPKNIKTNCITTALECVKKELNVTVTMECTDEYNYVPDLVHTLNKIANYWKNNTLPNISNECEQICEEWPLTPLTEFLDQTKQLYKLMNSQSQ